MTDRELIEDLLSALEYHTEQTRPIQFSTLAIKVAREHLRKPTQRKPLTVAEIDDAYFARKDGTSLYGCFLLGVRFAEATHNIKEKP